MFHFLQKKMLKKIRNKGTINVLQGEGQWSMVKDHTFTFFLDPSLKQNIYKPIKKIAGKRLICFVFVIQFLVGMFDLSNFGYFC